LAVAPHLWVALLEPHPDGLGTAGTVDRPLLGRRDADELPPLDPEDHAAAADLPAPDVGRAEHAVGREVVDLGRFLEEPGAGEAVVAVGFDDVVHDVTEEQARRPRLGAEPVRLIATADVL